MNPFRSLFLISIFSILLPGASSSASAANVERPSFETEEAPPENVVFSFLKNFSEAKAERRNRGQVSLGQWNRTGFQFPGSGPNTADIFTNPQTPVNGKNREAIWMVIPPGQEVGLTFPNVPPGHRLRFFYALPDYLFTMKAPAFTQVEVWVGKKKVYESQTNTKGWKEKVIGLTLPYLLQREIQVTVRARSLDPEPQILVFYGLVE